MTFPSEIAEFVEKARAEELCISVDAPRDPKGEWWLDLHDGKFHSELSWLAGRGFGVFVTEEAQFGARLDEIYRKSNDAIVRIMQLRSSWTGSKTIVPMWLKELRQLVGTPQTELAACLHVNQAAVSRFESRHNIQVSTLAQYIEAMGGSLELRAKFKEFEARLESNTVGRKRRRKA